MSKFLVWRPENGQDEEDGKTINAYDAEDAVEFWAKWYDQAGADYLIVSGQPATVKVRDLDSDAVSVWIVSGESVPSYSARRKAAGEGKG